LQVGQGELADELGLYELVQAATVAGASNLRCVMSMSHVRSSIRM
jgi:hypothetical protein